VTPGPRTTVGKVDVRFSGELAGEGAEREARRREIQAAWSLPPGAAFRSADWETAKTRIQETASEIDYAAATVATSEARVDAEAAKADLAVVIDSGPRFTLGDVFIEGLRYYPEAVIRRLVDVKRDERYSREHLEELQKVVQNGPWFSSVVVDVDRDPARGTCVQREEQRGPRARAVIETDDDRTARSVVAAHCSAPSDLTPRACLARCACPRVRSPSCRDVRPCCVPPLVSMDLRGERGGGGTCGSVLCSARGSRRCCSP